MAIYAVGDIQGCFSPLQRLLERCQFDPATDRLWVVGDIVNRGPASLQTLRFLHDLGNAATIVLGNHDLYLLMVNAGAMRRIKGDTLEPILKASDRKPLLDWLVQRPLIHVENNYILVHAGLLPDWTVAQAALLAKEVSDMLTGEQAGAFLNALPGNTPAAWEENLEGWSRLRVVVNALTRLRFCTLDKAMNFSEKGAPEDAPAGVIPWFKMPDRKSTTHTVVCGHWSALGLYRGDGVIALDTGCVWGGKLTAVRLDDGEFFQVNAD